MKGTTFTSMTGVLAQELTVVIHLVAVQAAVLRETMALAFIPAITIL
jgi:hypothetical protein